MTGEWIGFTSVVGPLILLCVFFWLRFRLGSIWRGILDCSFVISGHKFYSFLFQIEDVSAKDVIYLQGRAWLINNSDYSQVKYLTRQKTEGAALAAPSQTHYL